MVLLHSIKPHDCPVQFVKYSPDCSLLLSVGEDASFFWQRLGKPEADVQGYDPLCLSFLKNEKGESEKITDLCWHESGKKVLVSTTSGVVYEVTAPGEVDNAESYLVELPTRSWTVRMMEFQMKKFQKTEEQEKEEARQRRMARLRGEHVDEPE